MKENCVSDPMTEHSLQDAKNPDWSSSFEAIGKHTLKEGKLRRLCRIGTSFLFSQVGIKI